jgi:hypothetical protein
MIYEIRENGKFVGYKNIYESVLFSYDTIMYGRNEYLVLSYDLIDRIMNVKYLKTYN